MHIAINARNCAIFLYQRSSVELRSSSYSGASGFWAAIKRHGWLWRRGEKEDTDPNSKPWILRPEDSKPWCPKSPEPQTLKRWNSNGGSTNFKHHVFSRHDNLKWDENRILDRWTTLCSYAGPPPETQKLHNTHAECMQVCTHAHMYVHVCVCVCVHVCTCTCSVTKGNVCVHITYAR